MDKNTVIGLLLIAAVLIGFSYYTSYQQAQYLSEQSSKDSLAVAKAQTTSAEEISTPQPASTVAPLAADSADLFFASAIHADSARQAAPHVTLQNNK